MISKAIESELAIFTILCTLQKISYLVILLIIRTTIIIIIAKALYIEQWHYCGIVILYASRKQI